MYNSLLVGLATPLGTGSLLANHDCMLRVSEETRERVRRLAQKEFGGASADETIRRLLDEHWEAAALAAVRRYRAADPKGWADYLAEADEWAEADAPISDGWHAA